MQLNLQDPFRLLCTVLTTLFGGMATLGQGYFQQRVDHRIQVSLDDAAHVLRAWQEFDYTNHAPAALDTLWIHLWANAYSSRNTALCRQKDSQGDFDLHFAAPDERGFIDSLNFHGNGQELAWGLQANNPDIAWLALAEPLKPGGTVTISTPFRVKVPDARFSRLGHTGQAYYITQWYPKPAVYDAQGWHAMPYLDQGEFYSEFGSFDVTISLPANYVVGATGVLQDNPAEEAWMDSLAAVPLPSERSNVFPPSAKRMKTLRFVQESVHDFAWFADKRYLVRQGRVKLARSGRTVETRALFTPAYATLWADAVTYVNESVRLYSEWVGDYRYAQCTAVDGTIAAGGGMEYPMITIIGGAYTPKQLDEVIAHEVGHNWFYGMLASNERDHPWMDEGMNSFFEMRYMRERYGGGHSMDAMGIPVGWATGGRGIGGRELNELAYRFNARRNRDAPTASPSAQFGKLDYGTTVYMKSALIWEQLFRALGPERFDACTHAYFNAWAGRHPQPADVRASYEKASGEDLSWLFDELIGTADKVDVKAVRLKGDQLTYRSTAISGFPFPVTAWDGTDSLGTAWFRANQGKGSVTLPWPNASRARIDAGQQTLDIDRRNNEVRANGLPGRTQLPHLRFLAGLEREDRRTIYWAPALGYNTHDGWMAGVALTNTIFPSQRLEWAVAPLYGFQGGRMAGGGHIMWHADRIRSRMLRNVHVGISGFAATLYPAGSIDQWYQRVVPSVQFDPKLGDTGPEAFLRYRQVLLWHHAKGTYRGSLGEVPMDLTDERTFHEISANLNRGGGLHPYNLSLTFLEGAAFSRLSLEARWNAIYDRQKHRLTLRAFTGTFLDKDRQHLTPAMGWRMYWGSSDLLYDHLYIDRQYPGQNTAAQFSKDQGGFKTPTSVGTSDTWIAALNLELDFPFALPLAAFAGYGASPVTRVTQEGRTTDWAGNWEVGIGLRLWRDMVEVWVPLACSVDIRKEQEFRNFQFGDRIRFVLALEKMDPTQVLRKMAH